MVVQISQFLGEVPKLPPRGLPNGYAEVAQNCRLDRGMLEAMFAPQQEHVFGSNVQTIFHSDDDGWLGWNADVDVVPGPVATERLYITGDGAPRLQLAGGGTRALALPPPENRPTVEILANMREYLIIDGRDVRLIGGSNWKTTGGLDVNVSVSVSTATVTISSSAGITAAAAQTLVNGLQYKNTTTGTLAPGLKKVEITSIRDDGGVEIDDDRNQIGSDTRTLDGVICKVFVGGTAFDEVLPEPGPMDSSDVAAQNDPPTLTATPLHPSYAAAGAAAVSLFSSAAVSTIEAGQSIIRIVLTVSGLANGAIDPDASTEVVYSYTHVTDLDEESAPAQISKPILWSPGQVVRITGFSWGDTGRGVNRYRIYRSVTGSSGDTDLYFVAEVARLTTAVLDEIDAELSGEAITTMDFGEPPAALEGLTALPNGMLAGFVNKSLYFCEPYKPHAWPAKYILTTDFPILGLASLGSSIAVLTRGAPYIAQGTHPENMRMERIETPLPCISKRSIVPLSYGVAYASSDGLVVLGADGSARLVSKGLFTGRQWYVQMNPSTFRAARLDDLYVLSYDPDDAGRRMSLIDLSGDIAHVVRTTDVPTSFFLKERTGRLYFLDGARTVRQFDPTATGAGRRTYRWLSRLMVDAGAANLGAVYVECDDEENRDFTLRLYGDGVIRATVTRANAILPLPGGYRAKRWQVEIIGDRAINAVTLAHSSAEIAHLIR